MLKQKDIIELNITAYGSNGEGIANRDGFTFFVVGALIGETVKAKINFVKKNIAYANVIKVVIASEQRVVPRCKVFGKCGGCQLQYMSYDEQLRFKQNLVRNNFAKLGGMDIGVPDIVASKNIWGYRNKLSLPFGVTNGDIACGFFKADTHEIVPCDECVLQGDWAKSLTNIVKDFMRTKGLTAYDERTHKGTVRHVVGRYVDGQLLVTLVVNTEACPDCGLLASMLAKKFGKYGLFVNINKEKTNVILGKKFVHIAGQKTIVGEQFGVKFYLRPGSFYQVNSGIKDAIYGAVRESLELSGTDVLIDAYSGVGILSGALYSNRYETFAIEIEPSAVRDADEMKEANELTRLTNICGDVEVKLRELVPECKGKKVALIVDPPRKGLSASVVGTILDVEPRQIIYISCDSATLARDCRLLTEKYNIDSIRLYDMFPQTRHCESVVCLECKN